MAYSYRGHSQSSDSSGSSNGSPRGQYQQSSSQGTQYAYYSTPGQSVPSAMLQSSHGHYSGQYSTSPPSHAQGHGSPHGHRSSSRHATYPGPSSSAPVSERASKRQRAGTAPEENIYMQTPQWAATQEQGSSRHPSSQSHSNPGNARHRRDGSMSSGYKSPGFSHSNDPFGQQLLQPPPVIPGSNAAMRDATMYSMRQSRSPSAEYSVDEEEPLDHGPTEFPPRTYSGKSKYNPPKKPGKIPGSAMDYLPILEARFERLETAIDRYVDYRGQRALSNSILPGTEVPEGSSGQRGPSSSRNYYSSSKP